MIPDKPYEQKLPNGFSFEMIPVGAGSFWMGGKDEDAANDQKRINQVNIGYNFLIGKFLVTQDLWKAVMRGKNPSYFKGGRRPVERVSWYDAAVFCNALNEQCGYAPTYFSDPDFEQAYSKKNTGFILPNAGPVYRKPGSLGYRLPLEAEWEYTARGGAAGSPTKYAGSNILDEVGWYSLNSHSETKPVGLKLPNELGIFDMSGNVWEWCEDQWHDINQVAPDSGLVLVDWEQGSNRVNRGGSWFYGALHCRSANRFINTPANRFNYLGFRLVLFPFPV